MALCVREKEARAERVHQRWYRNRISLLTHNGNLYALTVLVISQVIFLNLHYIIGASLSVVSLCSLCFQIGISIAEERALTRNRLTRLDSLLYAHFIANHLVMALFVPFLIWTIVLMFQHQSASGESV